MIRAILVDDQARFRRKLKLMMELAGIEVVGVAEDIPSAELLVQFLQPELAVVDVMLPGMNGVDGMPCLKALAQGSLRVILISAYPDQAHQFDTMARAAGAEAFIAKDDLDLDLIRSWIPVEKP